jgi:hypothetical protein
MVTLIACAGATSRLRPPRLAEVFDIDRNGHSACRGERSLSSKQQLTASSAAGHDNSRLTSPPLFALP